MTRKRLTASLLVAMFLAGFGLYYWQVTKVAYPGITFNASYAPASLPTTTPVLPWPTYGGTAISLLGDDSIHIEHGTDKPLPTASVAKVMTALAVLDKKPLTVSQDGPTIPITEADVAIYNKYVAKDGSVVPVTAGEQLTEREALEALMLPSANNIAETLANWAFGSIEAYGSYANTKAKQLGMTDSNFTDPSGFLPDTVSTARDLVLLGNAALRQPVLKTIVGQSTATIPVAGTIRNVNVILGDKGINGIKTGNTDQAGGCYLFSAEVTPNGLTKPVQVVGAVMGAPDLATAMRTSLPFMDAVRSNFSTARIVAAGQTVGRVNTPWGATSDVVTTQALSTTYWTGQKITPELHYSFGNGGTISVNNGITQTNTALELKTTIHPPSIWWRLLHPFTSS